MLIFKAKSGEALVQAFFQSPAFSLMDPPASRFHQAIYSKLDKFGLTLGNVRIESTTNPISDANIRYDLLRTNSLVKISFDRLEVYFFSLGSVDDQVIGEILTGSLTGLNEACPEIKFVDFTTTVGVHGILTDMKLEEYMSRRIGQAPEGFGPSLGSGVVYYFGASGNRKSCSFTIDKSLVVVGGAYIRTVFTLDGNKVRIPEIPSACIKNVYDMYKSMGLDLQRDS